MTFKVKDFPIFHRYLFSIIQKVGLAEGSYTDILNTVGQYTVTGRCKCGDNTCNTIYLHSESLIGRDETFCYGFNVGYIIFNFYKDGALHLESLADRADFNFPFRHEVIDVFDGRSLEYDGVYADRVVEEFVKGLKEVDVVKVAV